MVKYYWNKYSNKILTKNNYTLSWINWTVSYGVGSTAEANETFYNYSLNPDTGEFTLFNPYPYAISPGTIPEGITLYRSWVGGYRKLDPYKAGSSLMHDAEIVNSPTNIDVIGDLIQSGIVAEENAFVNNAKNSDGYWYVRGDIANTAPTQPGAFTQPSGTLEIGDSKVISWGSSSDAEGNLSKYILEAAINNGSWTQIGTPTTNSFSYTIPTATSIQFRVKASDSGGLESSYRQSDAYAVKKPNQAPTVSLTSPVENVTLYENDTLNISGTAYDDDTDQSVTVYYQVNSEQRKVLATNLSQTQIALSKQLTFKGGKLYDGETAITGSLADGVAHKLKVWAEDSEKASSAIVEKTFYVVPNRAPLLSVDAVVPSGVVDADKFKISGTASDEDANSTLKVNRRINNGNAVEIYSGQGGKWEFDVSLGQLKIGENVIVVEVIDNYGAKASKTIKLNKNDVKTPILQSVARYKINPPAGSAKGVLLFIERDEEMDLKVELSMTLAGEQEQYETLTPNSTAPMPNTVGVVEDTYFYEAAELKDNIILKLSTTRPDETVNHKIHLISGAVE